MQITPELLEASYELLRSMPPFKRWKLPHADNVVFRVLKMPRLYAEHCPAAIAMFDRDMNYLVASRRWLIDFDLGDEPIIGRSHYEIFPEIPARWKNIHRRCLAGAAEHCDEDRVPRADGTTDWIRWDVLPWRRAGGEIGGILIFSEDITARKLAENALRESRAKLEAALAKATGVGKKRKAA